jgi:hypothetical protein
MKEFKFIMNEYENVCYVFVDVNMPPVDTLHVKVFNSLTRTLCRLNNIQTYA